MTTPFTAIKSAAYTAASRLGLARGFHRLAAPGDVSILLYHAVVREPLELFDWCFLSERAFVRQIAYLKDHFAVIPLADAVARLREGSVRTPTAVLTFDDGFYNNFSVAFPILRAAGLPATIFVTTGLVDTGDTLWFCRLHRALVETARPSLEWRGRSFSLRGLDERSAAGNAVRAMLKELPQPELLAELRGLMQRLDVDPDEPIEPGSPYRMLDHQAIEEMVGSGFVELGGHTRTHAILSRLSPGEQRAEIEHSTAAISSWTGRPCTLFAYPNGGPADYDATTVATLEACGVTTCVTTIEGPNDAATPPLELRRYGVGADMTPGEFEVTAHHLRSRLAAWIRRH